MEDKQEMINIHWKNLDEQIKPCWETATKWQGSKEFPANPTEWEEFQREWNQVYVDFEKYVREFLLILLPQVKLSQILLYVSSLEFTLVQFDAIACKYVSVGSPLEINPVRILQAVAKELGM